MRKLSYCAHHVPINHHIINQISIATAAFSQLCIKRRDLTVLDTQVQQQSRGAVFLVGNTFEALSKILNHPPRSC